MTRQRSAVLSQVTQHNDFRSAQQVHEDLDQSGNRVGLATVYRNLQALAQSGQLDTLQTEDGETLYRRCLATNHHHHLVCRRCGQVKEIAAQEIESWVRRLGSEYQFTDLEHSIEFYGTCSQCQE